MSGERQPVREMKRSLQAERDDAALYEALAEIERHPGRRDVFRELAAVERRHARHWEERLRAAGVDPGDGRPTRRVRLLGWIARRFGVAAVLPLVSGLERDAGVRYAAQAGSGPVIAREERAHERVVAALQHPTVPDGQADIAAKEAWHRHGTSSNLRAAVFGINDGLVSNLSLVMGVAGAGPEPRFVLLAGVSGLLAGAFSMAAGEYISVRSQRELYERQIALEREELEQMPEEEAAELALIYRAKGLTPELARRVADDIIAQPAKALDTLAREELGLDPDNLGSPWGAALASFAAFAVGAVIPVLPYFFTHGPAGFIISGAASAAALLAVGAILSLFTGRGAVRSGLRMLLIGAAAAAVTFGIGRLIGVAVH
ncbi:MAG TPA: VIT1/CCC1 family protein [Polyangia bacterium]|jgi:VIT1/CCC1 family predicted Fe2+/Mn2+ transporter